MAASSPLLKALPSNHLYQTAWKKAHHPSLAFSVCETPSSCWLWVSLGESLLTNKGETAMYDRENKS